MFHPLPVFIGLRYVRARSHKFFVSFITWASLVGVCVGVAALIVILSVMNGFEGELRGRLLALSAHLRLIPAAGAAPPAPAAWAELSRRVRGLPGVVGVAPYAEAQVLAVHTPEMVPIVLRGIDPRAEPQVSEVARDLTEGRLGDLEPGSDRIIVGAIVAEQLAVGRGDHLTLLIPTLGPDGAPAPRLREFTVAGVFEVGLQDHDASLAFTHIDDVRALAVGGTGDAGLRVRLADALAAPAAAVRVRAILGPGLQVIDWTADNASYFRAIRIEKTMMSLILLLIVAVAAFNIVAMLVMVVTDKRTDIAILRTFGAAPRRVMGIFVTQGLVIGWLGVLLGIGLGLLLACNVEVIVPFLERTLGFHLMDADVYYVTRIPSEVRAANVLVIGAAALGLTALATLYPALRAAATAPAEALRYE